MKTLVKTGAVSLPPAHAAGWGVKIRAEHVGGFETHGFGVGDWLPKPGGGRISAKMGWKSQLNTMNDRSKGKSRSIREMSVKISSTLLKFSKMLTRHNRGMTINFPISKFLARGLMCAAIFAGSASVVRGQAIGSSSAYTQAGAGDGPDAIDTSSLFASSVSFGKVMVDTVQNGDGTSTGIYASVDAEANALARWTEHSVAVTASAEVNNSTDQSTGEANATANASLYTLVHIYSLDENPEGGHWKIAVHSIFAGPEASAHIGGTITTYDDQGMPVDEQNFGASPNSFNNLGDSTNYVDIPCPGVLEGYTVVIELSAHAQASASQGDSDGDDADLGDTVWLQFVADDPSTLSAVAEDGWDFSTPYSRAPATAFAPTLTPYAFTNNQFQFIVSGTINSHYIVQATTDLASTNWIPLITNSAPFIFTETNANLYAQRFYRALVAP